jgi:hypothetical protein
MAGLVAGCMRPSGPSGLVRAGQTGRYVTFELGRPLYPYEMPPVERPPLLLLDAFVEPGYKVVATGYITPLKTADTPIVVTENAGDEEFWEFMFRAVDRPFLVLGGRDQCEAMRVEQKDVRPGPCIGPHYFKRTGPPDRS